MASDKRLDQVKLVNSAESVLVVNGDQVEKAALAGFANSMGSSVPLQQTSEQVSITGLYARTSDGKMVELTKESVASVMAGLMGNPFGTKSINDVNDCNDILTNGIFPFSSLPLNGPSGESSGAIISFYSPQMKLQLYITDVSLRLFYRKQWYNNDWSVWKAITTV